MRHVLLSLVALAALLASRPAAAQLGDPTPGEASPQPAQVSACTGGRMVTSLTAGRCCWPAQSWNDERARCEGPPSCPSGMVAEGDRCSAPTPPQPPPAQPPAATYQPPPAAAAPPASGWEPGFEREEEGSEPIMGLFIAGVSMLGAMYLGTAAVSVAVMTSCCSNGFAAINFIPVLGPIIYTPTEFSSSSDAWVYFYFPATIIQSVSFVMMIAGLAIRRPTGRRGSRRASGATPELVGGPGELGAGLRWTF